MKKKNLVMYIIIFLVTVVGIIVWKINGFNKELQYSSRNQIQLSNYTGIEKSDIEQMASEILGNERYFIQKVETFGNSVAITADSISEEQRDQFVTKFNEKYSTELKNEDTEIVSLPFTRVIDVIKPFIAPGIATLAVLTICFIIRYRKTGVKQVLAKTVLLPIICELLIFSIISITRIPFGRLAIGIGVSVYLLAILALTIKFENKRNEYLENSQTKNKGEE